MLQPCQRVRAVTAAANDAPPGLSPLLILINALDECHAADEIEFVLALLS